MPALWGTPEQQLIHLNMHWGSRYDFTAPKRSGGKWAARAKFGEHDELTEQTASELLQAVRSHYQARHQLPRRRE
jgi:hypothetical protein